MFAWHSTEYMKFESAIIVQEGIYTSSDYWGKLLISTLLFFVYILLS